MTARTEMFMSIRHFAVASAKQRGTVTTCFEADVFSPDSLSYVKFLFSFWPVVTRFCFTLSSFITQSTLPIHSVSFINVFCCEVVIQELSNQILIILPRGQDGTTCRVVPFGWALISLTLLPLSPSR